VRALLDPGWLFVIGGLALLMSVVLIPAYDDLLEARYLRDRALAIEAHRKARLERHQEFLTALDEQDPALVMSLVASQLNKIPIDREPLGPVVEPPREAPGVSLPPSASVFPALEPEPAVLPRRVRVESTLHRWATDERARLWVIAAGALLVLVGLLPASRK
jgi:hypothetical protein